MPEKKYNMPDQNIPFQPQTLERRLRKTGPLYKFEEYGKGLVRIVPVEQELEQRAELESEEEEIIN